MSAPNPMPALRALLDDHEERYGRGDLWRAASEEMAKVEELLESISPHRVNRPMSYYIGVAKRMRSRELVIKPMEAQ